MEYYKYIITGSEITCIFVTIVLILSSLGLGKYKIKKNKYYLCSLFSLLLLLIIDILSWNLVDKNIITVLINLISYTGVLIILIFFTFYISSIIDNKPFKNNTIPKITLYLSILGIIFNIILQILGKLIVYKNGTYTFDNWYFLTIIIVCICFILLGLFIIKNIKIIGIAEVKILMLYLIIPFISLIISLIPPYIEFGYVAITFSLLIVFNTVQSKALNELDDKGKILEYYSYIDQLTELKNRRALDELIEMNKNSQISIGVLFTDVNYLKYVNDNFGHNYGDNLLKKYSNILTNHFKHKYIYRISGDEFIVVIENIKKEEFIKLYNNFHNTLLSENNIASAGFSFGTINNAKILIHKAEEMMYKNKKEFHKINPPFNIQLN